VGLNSGLEQGRVACWGSVGAHLTEGEAGNDMAGSGGGGGASEERSRLAARRAERVSPVRLPEEPDRPPKEPDSARRGTSALRRDNGLPAASPLCRQSCQKVPMRHEARLALR